MSNSSKPPVKSYTLGRDRNKKEVAIYESDRIHTGVFGFPGCLAGDALVVLENGEILKIRDAAAPKGSVTPISMRVFPSARATAFHVYDVDRTIQVTTETGKRLRLTENHPLFVKMPSGFVWRPASELSVGDQVRTFGQIPSPTDRVRINDEFVRMTRCMDCGNSDSKVLKLDGIPFGRPTQRRMIKGFSEDVLCYNCSSLRRSPRKDVALQKVRLAAVEALGGRCVKCSFAEPGALFVQSRKGGVEPCYSFYKELRDGHPSGHFLLCRNCYYLKRRTINGFVPSMPLEWSPDLARLLGIFVAEGSLCAGRVTFNINAEEVDFRNEISGLMTKVFSLPSPRLYQIKGKKSLMVKYDSTVLMHWFSRYNAKEIPSEVLRSPADVAAAFLSGLFEGDGTVSFGSRERHRVVSGRFYTTTETTRVVSLKSSERALLEQVQVLLLRWGIRSRIYSSVELDKRSGKSSRSHVLRIGGFEQISRFAGEIGFISAAKAGRLSALLGSYRRIMHRQSSNVERIKSIEVLDGVIRVYDLEVPETHSFFSSGILSHNTGKSTWLLSQVWQHIQKGEGFCLAPDQLVMVRKNGKVALQTVGSLYGEAGGSPSLLEVPGLDANSRVVWKSVTAFHKIPSPETLLEVETVGGRRLTVTADHPFFTLSDLEMARVRAGDLAVGDYVAVPSRLRYDGPSPTEIDLADFKYSRHTNGRKFSKISITDDFLEWLGWFVSEGRLGRDTVSLSNKDSRCVSRMVALVERSFGISTEPWRMRSTGVSYVNVNSRVISRMVREKLGFTFAGGKKGKSKIIPDFVYSLQEARIGSFLRGMYSGDGSVGEHAVHYDTVSERLASGLSYLLSYIGISSSLHKYASGRFRVKVSAGANLERFSRLVGFVQDDKNEKVRSILTGYAYRATNRDVVPVAQYLYGVALKHHLTKSARHLVKKDRVAIRRESIPAVLRLLEKHGALDWATRQGLMKLYDSDASWDRISKITAVPKSSDFVYDFTVKDTHMFVCGSAPTFVSNCLMDPHGDLAKKVLTFIPPEKAGNLIYVDPMTAFKYKKVVKINFLQVEKELDKGFVSRTFLDSLLKLYQEYWGPRLDMILMNAIYVLFEQEKTKLPDLYYVIADEDLRDTYLSKVTDHKVLTFWRSEFKKMPKEASSSAMTKIYKIIQEKIIVPMFDTYESSFDFRKAMDEGKWIIVNLSEGRLTTDIANFVGSLIMSRIYIAGMMREETPEEERVPFYVYIDEAHRFTTSSIKDILEALRKYKVFATVASQYLEQYSDDVRRAIPSLCDTLISFRVGKDTARTIEEFFKPYYTYEQLMQLPNYWFAVSAKLQESREFNVLKTINVGKGPYNPEEVIQKSLDVYGREIEAEHRIGVAGERYELPYPPLDVAEWEILVTMYYDQLERWTKDTLNRELYAKGLGPRDVERSKNRLVSEHYVRFIEEQSEYFESGRKRQKTEQIYSLDQRGIQMFKNAPVGTRGGGDRHIIMMQRYTEQFIRAGFYCIIDPGDVPGKKLPDILVYPPAYHGDVMDAKMWDTPHRFAVEVEAEPEKHPDRVKGNWEKNFAMDMPVLFVTDTESRKGAILKALPSQQGGARIVSNIQKSYAPGYVQINVEDLSDYGAPAVPEAPQESPAAPAPGAQPVPPPVPQPRVPEPIKEAPPTPPPPSLIDEMKKYHDDGWRLTTKTVTGGKEYVYARKSIKGQGREEESLGRATDEAKALIQSWKEEDQAAKDQGGGEGQTPGGEAEEHEEGGEESS